MQLVTEDSARRGTPNRGAKAANLAALRGLGVLIPRWAAIPADAPSADLQDLVRRAYDHVGGGRVAVRSSGIEEDGAGHSFAGQFDTYLGVEGLDEVTDRVRSCRASASSERSLAYRRQHGLPDAGAGLGVIIQRMVPAEVSGVLFTADPATGSPDSFVIGAVYGLGEGMVSGAVDADSAELDADTGAVLTTGIGAKAHRYDPGPDGGVMVTDVPEAERAVLALDKVDLAELHAAGRRIMAAAGTPQDIEWAVAGGRLWILQSRPITTPLREPGGELRIWENANIVESFRGVTSPLTFTFAAMAYGAVYESFARSLRVPGEQLRQMQAWLPDLLGSFHGRVYYNPLNWYRLQRIPPFYDINRKLLEVAMGVDEPLPDALAETLHPYHFPSPAGGAGARLVTGARFLWKFARMDRDVRRFTSYFYESYAVFDKRDYAAMPADRVYRAFQDLQRDLLQRWGPMQMLDSTILLSMGVLTVLGRRWLPDAPQWLTWAAARPGPGVESAEPARAMAALAATVNASRICGALIVATSPAEIPAALVAGGHTGFAAAVDAYVAEHGYRSPDELKLEVPDLREDPASLYLMLRDALQAPPETQGNDQAQEYLDAHLRGPRRRVYELVRRKASRSLAARERLRFCRTRAFGSAKQILRALGRHLHAAGAIDRFEDVFQLRLEELTGAYEGKIAHDELRDLVAVRRRTAERQALWSAPSRFVTAGAPYWAGNLERAGWTTEQAVRTGAAELRGTPSAPGVATGRVVVATRPQDVNGGILVTYSTDPGWVAALPSAAGLIIERGSPLTHVAIVARELGVPTIVKVPGATRELQTGMLIRMDGGAATITVLDEAPLHEAPLHEAPLHEAALHEAALHEAALHEAAGS